MCWIVLNRATHTFRGPVIYKPFTSQVLFWTWYNKLTLVWKDNTRVIPWTFIFSDPFWLTLSYESKDQVVILRFYANQMSPPTNEPWFPSSQSESDSQFWTLFTTQKWLLSNFMMCMWLYRFIYLFFLGKNFSSIWLKSGKIVVKGFLSYLNYLIDIMLSQF